MIIDILCSHFDEHGKDSDIEEEQLKKQLSERGATRGQIDIAFLELSNANRYFVSVSETSDTYFYSATFDEYKSWSENREELKAENQKDHSWKPLLVENFEDIAGETETLAEELLKDNGYKANHEAEANYTIENFRRFASSLREGKGEILAKHLEQIIELVERLSQIFDKATRLGKIVAKIYTLFSGLF